MLPDLALFTINSDDYLPSQILLVMMIAMKVKHFVNNKHRLDCVDDNDTVDEYH